jgi:uncharacterized protein YqfA (UPF0365 family)
MKKRLQEYISDHYQNGFAARVLSKDIIVIDINKEYRANLSTEKFNDTVEQFKAKFSAM